MFSLGSLSSISLATVTPSLVIVGLPNFLSMTTLRPLGPSVAVTAAAIMLMPLSRLDRASSSNFSCFGIARVPPYSRMARTSSSRMIRYSLSSSFTSEPEYFPKRILSPALTSRGTFLPSSVTLPLPTATTLPSWGFSLAVSGMMIPPFLTSFSSSRSTRRRSCNGRIFIGWVSPSDFGIRRAPFIMALDAPKRLPIDSDEHDGLDPMRVGPPRRAMPRISCALLATRRPPLWLDAKAADSPRSLKPPIPCAYRYPATRRRAAANHAGSSLSRGGIPRSHPLRMPSRSPPAPRPIRAPVRSTSSGLAREAHRDPSSVASCPPAPEAYLPPPITIAALRGHAWLKRWSPPVRILGRWWGRACPSPPKTCQTGYRAAILCQVELETSEAWT